MDRLDRVSRKYSLLASVDKTKVMASDGIACRILIQNEQLEQVDYSAPPDLLAGFRGDLTSKGKERKRKGEGGWEHMGNRSAERAEEGEEDARSGGRPRNANSWIRPCSWLCPTHTHTQRERDHGTPVTTGRIHALHSDAAWRSLL